MKPFRFTLEALATVRERQEQNAMELYAQSLLFRRQAMDKVQAVESELAQVRQDWQNQLTAGCTAAQAQQTQVYHRALTLRRDDCLLGLESAERRVNAALQNMLSARQEREIVAKYRDKQKVQHARETARAEQKFMDELAGHRGSSLFAWDSAAPAL